MCDNKYTFANIFETDDSLACIQLTNSTKYSSVSYDLLDPQRTEAGMQMKFSGGDNVSVTMKNNWSPLTADDIAGKEDETYNFALNFNCNQDVDMAVGSWYLDKTDFTYYVDINTKYGCPLVTLDQVSQFIDDNKIPFFIVGLLLGTIEAILGLRLFVPTLFAFGFVTGFFVTMFTFFGSVITPDSNESTKWILLVFSLIIGISIGYATVKMSRLGIFCIGAWFGIIIGLLLYNAFIYKWDSSNMIGFIITLCVFGLSFGILAIKKQRHLIIAASSLCGSYLAVRAASLLIGYFPNELGLIKAMEVQDDTYTIPWQFYVYMNVVILLTIFSMCAQYKIKRHYDKKKELFEFEVGEYIKNEDY